MKGYSISLFSEPIRMRDPKTKYLKYSVIYVSHLLVGLWVTLLFKYNIITYVQIAFISIGVILYWGLMLYTLQKLSKRKDYIEKWKHSWVLTVNVDDTLKLLIFLFMVSVINVCVFYYLANYSEINLSLDLFN